MSLLIRDATVVTVDPSRRLLDPGAVYVEGARIVDVGPTSEVAGRHPTATRVIDGRHRSSQLSVRSEVVNRHVPALVIGFLIALIGVTIGIALIADGLGAPQPGLIASVLVAIAALIGGPQLMTFVRRRAERSERR